MQGKKFRNQLAYRHEIADKTNPGAHRHQHPQRIFQHALAPLLAAPRLARQFQLLGAVALDFLLNPEKNLGINRVRTGITTPDTAKQGGGKKEQQREPQQDKRQQNKILRPDIQAKNIEAAVRQVEKNRLATVPLKERQYMENTEQHQECRLAQTGEAPLHRARPDFDVLLVERFRLRWRDGCHDDSLRSGAGRCRIFLFVMKGAVAEATERRAL